MPLSFILGKLFVVASADSAVDEAVELESVHVEVGDAARDEASKSASDEAMESAPDEAMESAPDEAGNSEPDEAGNSEPDEASKSTPDATGKLAVRGGSESTQDANKSGGLMADAGES